MRTRAKLITHRNTNGRTNLHCAAASGLTRNAERLILMGADLASEDNMGWTALDLALLNNHFEIAKM